MIKIIKYSKANARKDLPTRKKQDNKTHGGKCLVIAGSKGYYGAAILTCLAASRTGAGYTHLLTSGKFPIAKHPDFLIVTGKPAFSSFQAIAMGPGFIKSSKIKNYLKQLISQKAKNVVLDAEALNTLASVEIKLPPSWIVTPHEGELARILGVSSALIRNNRKKYILIAQRKLGCIVLLKGHRTLICDGTAIYEIQTGNASLAKAGTGDVLTGIILGLLSQRLNTLTAAKLATHIHGLIADNWLKSKKDILSLMASDLIELLPKTLFLVRRSN